MTIGELVDKFKAYADVCRAYVSMNSEEDNSLGAEYHRGAKEAFERCAEELEKLRANAETRAVGHS